MNRQRALRDLGRMVGNPSMHSQLLGLIEAGDVPVQGYGIETPRWTLLMASLKQKQFSPRNSCGWVLTLVEDIWTRPQTRTAVHSEKP